MTIVGLGNLLDAMYSRPNGSDGRESRQWWAVNDDSNRVHLVVGWSCAPNTPGIWWVPELGCSMEEGYHLYATEQEAKAKLIAELEEKRNKIEARLAELVAGLLGVEAAKMMGRP